MKGPSSWLEVEGPRLPWGGDVAPCFVVNALAHLKEEAIRCVSAAVVEVSYPPAATATVADMLAFAFPPVGRVGVGVVTSQFAEVNNGARGGYFGLNRSGEGAFSSVRK
eukprot:scaffold3180_cov196-Isochrysis_galbana.AAC.1